MKIKYKRYMKTKSIFATFALAASLMSLSSCEKEGVKLFDGNYSFKTSGTVTMQRTLKDSGNASAQAVGDDDTDFPDINIPDIDLPDINFPNEGDGTVDVQLSSESGQMNIIKTGDNSVWVTMNIVGGDALTFNATAEGKTLTLEPATRMMSFRDGTRTVSIKVTVSGTAEKHDDVAIFKLEYTGKGETTLYDYEIKESDVKCVAKLNED